MQVADALVSMVTTKRLGFMWLSDMCWLITEDRKAHVRKVSTPNGRLTYDPVVLAG